jgi:DNA-binding MarR family transcriptional regulator
MSNECWRAGRARLNWAAMARIRQLSKAEYEALASFRYSLRRFLNFSDAAAQAAGITPQKHQALLAIKGFPGRDHLSVGELAQRLLLRHHSAVGLVDRLVAEKLVMRAPSVGDRRQVFVRLTNRGESILLKLSSAHRKQLKRTGPELGSLLKRLARHDESRVGSSSGSPRNR